MSFAGDGCVQQENAAFSECCWLEQQRDSCTSSTAPVHWFGCACIIRLSRKYLTRRFFQKYLRFAFGLLCVRAGECFPAGAAACAAWGALGDSSSAWCCSKTGRLRSWQRRLAGKAACRELLLFPKLALGERWKTLHVEK